MNRENNIVRLNNEIGSERALKKDWQRDLDQLLEDAKSLGIETERISDQVKT